MHEDINVKLIDMDVKIPEQVTKNLDGSYTIFLNARFNQEYRAQAYQHALEHIQNGDFDRKTENVQDIEMMAHGLKSAILDQNQEENINNRLRRRKRRRDHTQEQYARDRLNFILEHCGSYSMAEHNYLYGKDL